MFKARGPRGQRIGSALGRIDRSLEKLYDRANTAGRSRNWGEHLRITTRIGTRLQRRGRLAPPAGGKAPSRPFKAPKGGLMRILSAFARSRDPAVRRGRIHYRQETREMVGRHIKMGHEAFRLRHLKRIRSGRQRLARIRSLFARDHPRWGPVYHKTIGEHEVPAMGPGHPERRAARLRARVSASTGKGSVFLPRHAGSKAQIARTRPKTLKKRLGSIARALKSVKGFAAFSAFARGYAHRVKRLQAAAMKIAGTTRQRAVWKAGGFNEKHRILSVVERYQRAVGKLRRRSADRKLATAAKRGDDAANRRMARGLRRS